jgi:uncharacterized protein (TIGR02271 family)
MFQRSHVQQGMMVYSSDGEKLGKVFAVSDTEFQVEKGLFFPKDYVLRFEDIIDIRGGDVIVRHARASLGAASGTALGRGLDRREDLGTERTVRSSTEAVAIPVHREELDVLKRERQAGEVRVHKDVVEEERRVDVPVRREVAWVERRDVNPDRPAMNASFQEETIRVPLRAEEVEVRKRAVLDEEVVIRKDSVEEERRVAETVRHEEVSIRTDGDVEESRRSLNLGTEDDPTRRRS